MTQVEELARKALAELCPGGGPALLGVEPMAGQASARKYHRLLLDRPCADSGARSLVLVELGESPLKSAEASCAQTCTELPFTLIRGFLEQAGVRVPALVLDRWQQGFQLQSDLGDVSLKRQLEATPARRLDLLEQAVEFLVEFQARLHGRPAPELILGRSFGHELLLWELHHFKEWLLLDYAGAKLTPAQDALLEAFFESLCSRLLAQPYRIVHRDFQSTNIMMTPQGMALIDFQDALLGPEPYDLVALLRDSYVPLSPEELKGLVAHYVRLRRGSACGPVAGGFERAFHVQTLQRKLKDAGRFVFIDRVRGNPSFLKYIPATLGYIFNALAELGDCPEVLALLEQHCQGALSITE